MPGLPRITRRTRPRGSVEVVSRAGPLVLELAAFIGHDYLVTLPNRELLPVTRLFARCESDETFREQLFAKGAGRLLYEVLDDLFDYCFPILDKIGHKLDVVEDDIFERRAEDVVRDISDVKQE